MDTPTIEDIKARWAEATPGPWVDLTKVYFDRMRDYQKRTKKWWHGTRAWSLPVVLIASALDRRGESFTAEDIPERVDWHDLNTVIGWRWGVLSRRTTSIGEGFFKPEDAGAVAHAPSDIAFLLAEVERLRAAIRDVHDAGHDTSGGNYCPWCGGNHLPSYDDGVPLGFGDAPIFHRPDCVVVSVGVPPDEVRFVDARTGKGVGRITNIG